jgi:hypothetical protein
MNNPCDLHSWSTQYREERLAEARKLYLARREGSRSTLVSLLLVMLALAVILLGASACTDSASSSVSADTGDSSASASARSSTSASTSADASSSASLSSSADSDASNYAGMRSSSIECYTFYSDGTVELRHGGTSAISDSGSYQGDDNFGEIVWDSGKWTSTVVAEGDGLIIDDLKVSPVANCF